MTHRDDVEREYGMAIEELLVEWTAHDEMSQHEMADKLGIPRTSLRYYLKQSRVEPPERTLSDVQRILIMGMIPFAGNGAISRRVGCSPRTVRRYRKELAETGDPVDLAGDLSEKERAVLDRVIADWRRRKHGNDFACATDDTERDAESEAES